MFRKYENKIFLWLGSKIQEVSKKRAESLAVLGENSHVYGEINNPSNHKEKIAIGNWTTIDGRLLVFFHDGKIQIGDWCYVGRRTEIWSMASIDIGDRVFISHNVNIIDGTAHPRDPEERHNQYRKSLEEGPARDWQDLPGVKAGPIVIEDDVWINFGVTILKGVRIGRGSVIAANSIITKDVPPHVLYRNSITPIVTPLS
jgi:maltose O-acetyltransferase